MTNGEIADIFKNIAAQLELEGENPFRIKAYRRAAETLVRLPEPLDKMAREGRIQSIPGIGKDLEQKILDLLSNGEIRESPGKYAPSSDRLSEEPYAGEPPSLSIPGLDPKITRLLRKRFRMETREDLENLARSRLLRTVPELGARIEKLILEACKKTADPGDGKKVTGPGPP